MRYVTFHIEGKSPYSASAPFQSVKGDKEKHDKFEERCWMERLNVNADGQGIIPIMAFKKSFVAGQAYDKIKLQKQETFGKIIVSGLLPLFGKDLILEGVTRENVASERCFVPSDGKPGGSSRVVKIFPLVMEWKGTIEMLVTDDRLTEDVLAKIVHNAGLFVGVGRWRIANGGMYGRYTVTKMENREYTA